MPVRDLRGGRRMKPFRLFGEIAKVEDQEDGTIKVFGIASSGARDDAGEIVLPDAMKAALPDYAKYPALREMHQPSAAGRTLEAEVDASGRTNIIAHVVDPTAIAKVKTGTYAGFSIGGRVLERDAKDRTVITRIKLNEISLVDRPANPEASIDLWKADIGEHEPMSYTPSNDEVKARAGEMAKMAGKPETAWKDYVAKAREALIAEHVETDPEAAVSPEIVEAVDKAAVGLSEEDRDAVLAKVAAAIEAGGDLDDEVTKAIAEHQAAREADLATEPTAADALAAAIEKAKSSDDSKGDYGDVEYADPGYQPDGKKRYPIDTAEHIRAAWNYINKKKNADKYTADQAASPGDLAKSLYDVGRVAMILQELGWIADCLKYERAVEGDDSTAPE